MDHHDDATAAAVEALVSIPTGTEEHGDQQYETTGGPSPQAFPAAGDADQDYQPETRYDPYAHSGGQEGGSPFVCIKPMHHAYSVQTFRRCRSMTATFLRTGKMPFTGQLRSPRAKSANTRTRVRPARRPSPALSAK